MLDILSRTGIDHVENTKGYRLTFGEYCCRLTDLFAVGTVQTTEYAHRGSFLVHRLAYNGDVVAFKMGRRQGGPSRTGSRGRISKLIFLLQKQPNSQSSCEQH